MWQPSLKCHNKRSRTLRFIQEPTDDDDAKSAFFRIPSAHAIASFLPFSISIKNQITNDAAKHSAKRKGKPIQLLPDLSIIAWMTFGPIIEDARLESPKSPKNCDSV